MNHEEQVQRALKALAEHDRAAQSVLPPPAMPRHLRPAPKWATGAGYAAVLAAAAALVLNLLPDRESAPAPAQPALVSVAPPPPTAPDVAKETTPVPKPARPARRTPVAPEEPPEVVTEFFPLMEAPPPFERGQLLRVLVPASTLRTVGLPVNPERWSQPIPADVLIGEEGMPRAIRFVSFEP